MNFEKLSTNQPEINEGLKPKHATRTVLFDEDDKVEVINVTKHGYYKIPGGGLRITSPLRLPLVAKFKKRLAVTAN